MRILVTGSNGLIGRHAVEALAARGHSIDVVSRNAPRAEFRGRVTFHRADLLDEAAVDDAVPTIRADMLLHFAWITEHGQFWQSAQNLDWLGASLRLVRRFVEAGGKRVVTAGTCAEYDWQRLPPHGICSEESTPLGSAFLYGVTKDALRRCVATYARQNGLSCAHGRIFLVYGDGESVRRLIPSVVRALLAGETARVSTGEQVRDFISARDLGHAFAALLTSSVEGPVNMGTGRGIRLKDLVEMIRKMIGGEVAYGAVPSNPDDPTIMVADPRRLIEQVPFAPFTSLEDGLSEIISATRAAS